MIRAFRVSRCLARPARLGTLAREGRVGAWARCLRRALALAHTMCRAANYSNQGAAPGRPWHRRLEDSVAKVWSFEERPPVLRLCGAAAESSARKKKSTAPNVIRLLLIHVDICFLLVHVELGQYHVQGRYSG